MKKAWSDLKSFITVIVMILFAYSVIAKVPMTDVQTQITLLVVGAFIGAKAIKDGEK